MVIFFSRSQTIMLDTHNLIKILTAIQLLRFDLTLIHFSLFYFVVVDCQNPLRGVVRQPVL